MHTGVAAAAASLLQQPCGDPGSARRAWRLCPRACHRAAQHGGACWAGRPLAIGVLLHHARMHCFLFALTCVLYMYCVYYGRQELLPAPLRHTTRPQPTPSEPLVCAVCCTPAALVFRGIGFFDVGVLVFTGQLAKLAAHIVPCGPAQRRRSKEQWVQLLKERLRPVPPRPRPAAAARTKAA